MTYRNKSASEEGINRSGEKCVICGWAKRNAAGKSFVIGAHVRPFETGSEFDKADNIIGLCPNHHTEFDNYNFYVDPEDLTLHFRDSNDEYEGVCIEKNVRHIKKDYWAYRLYLYRKHYQK